MPLKQEIVGTAESTLLVLAGAAAAVLLLACVNVAGLLLGRASSRSREIGVRAALGATRWRLARQMLVESVVLAAAGGVIGIGLAYGAIAALTRFGPADLPRLQAIAIDGHVLGSSRCRDRLLRPGIRVRAGLAPGACGRQRRIARRRPIGGRRFTSADAAVLAAAEVALAFVLIVSSGLLLRSFIRMMNADPGFEPGRAITVSVDLPTARYDTPASTAFYQRAADRLRRCPASRKSPSARTCRGRATTKTPASRLSDGSFLLATVPKRVITSLPMATRGRPARPSSLAAISRPETARMLRWSCSSTNPRRGSTGRARTRRSARG